MGSIPTRSRHAALVVCLTIALAAPLVAQQPDSARAGITARTTEADTVAARVRARPPVSPRSAFLRSLLVPGWGQSKLDRGTAGALFTAVEVGAVAMLINSQRELNAARRVRNDSVFVGWSTDTPPVPIFEPAFLSDRVRARRQQVEDWAAIVIANHLLSGLDAFIAAHLWDLPTQVSVRQTENGTALAARVSW
ncbi:MAG TPA: hypothetical protein VJ672_08560 [Gemmatimonadaceae bacterium]|nr:hypothetical protein [Gemmatimonadaceae bacterium]